MAVFGVCWCRRRKGSEPARGDDWLVGSRGTSHLLVGPQALYSCEAYAPTHAQYARGLEAAAVLLEHGADMEEQDESGRCRLMGAAVCLRWTGRWRGVDPTRPTRSGPTNEAKIKSQAFRPDIGVKGELRMSGM